MSKHNSTPARLQYTYLTEAAKKFYSPNSRPLLRGSKFSAGFDLKMVGDEKTVTIFENQVKIIPTGIAIDMSSLPKLEEDESGFWVWEAQVRPRSGLAAKYGITVLNSPGTIDEDYRNEIKVILAKIGRGLEEWHSYVIQEGDRIAQLVFDRVYIPKLEYVDQLTESERGLNGLGSTGTK